MIRRREDVREKFSTLLGLESNRMMWIPEWHLQQSMDVLHKEIKGTEDFYFKHWLKFSRYQQNSSSNELGKKLFNQLDNVREQLKKRYDKNSDKNNELLLIQYLARDHLFAYFQEPAFWSAKNQHKYSSNQDLIDVIQSAFIKIISPVGNHESSKELKAIFLPILKNYDENLGNSPRSFVETKLERSLQQEFINSRADYWLEIARRSKLGRLKRVSQKKLKESLELLGIKGNQIQECLKIWKQFLECNSIVVKNSKNTSENDYFEVTKLAVTENNKIAYLKNDVKRLLETCNQAIQKSIDNCIQKLNTLSLDDENTPPVPDIFENSQGIYSDENLAELNERLMTLTDKLVDEAHQVYFLWSQESVEGTPMTQDRFVALFGEIFKLNTRYQLLNRFKKYNRPLIVLLIQYFWDSQNKKITSQDVNQINKSVNPLLKNWLSRYHRTISSVFRSEKENIIRLINQFNNQIILEQLETSKQVFGSQLKDKINIALSQEFSLTDDFQGLTDESVSKLCKNWVSIESHVHQL